MPADKESRRLLAEDSTDGTVIILRVSADVLEQDIHLLHTEARHVGIERPQIASVSIAANGPHGPELCQTPSHVEGTYVARVPDFVARFKIFKVAFVPPTMGVAKDADACHSLLFSKTAP